MPYHDLNVYLDRQKAKTTAALIAEVEAKRAKLCPLDGHNFKVGEWFFTRGGDRVRIVDVSHWTIKGALWGHDGERWNFRGTYLWKRETGRFGGGAIPDEWDLVRPVPKPEEPSND